MPPLSKFNEKQIQRIKSGWPIFCWYGDQLMMVSYVNGEFKAFEVKAWRDIPRPTLIDRVKQFMSNKPFSIDLNEVKRIDRFEYDCQHFNAVIENGTVTVKDKETGEVYKRSNNGEISDV